ncbi:303_t:CDS:2, partial [Scutellospora calospora]
MLVSSTIIYYIERGYFNQEEKTWYRVNSLGQNEKSPFQSIIHSFWWSIATITTTGYGDAVPVTGLGRLFAGFTMLFGILFFALPTSIIGSNLVTEWNHYYRWKFQMRMRKALEQCKVTNKSETSSFESRQSEKNILYFKKQNSMIFDAISEVQELLYDINPVKFGRYKDLQIRYAEALEKINGLEIELGKWKKIASNNNSFKNNDTDSEYEFDQVGSKEKKNSFSSLKGSQRSYRTPLSRYARNLSNPTNDKIEKVGNFKDSSTNISNNIEIIIDKQSHAIYKEPE